MNYGKRGTEQKIQSLRSRRKKYASKISFSFVKLLFVMFLFLGVVAAGAGLGMINGIIRQAPELSLDSIVPAGYATTVYDSAGNLTDTLVKTGSNREEATYDELPQDLIDAFVAIEDARFWKHNGIDLRSIARAAVGVITGDYKGGASTITQQLIKNNVLDGGGEDNWGDRIERKVQEQYLALQLEKSMSKELIITNYLNTINLGNNTLGVKVAAKRYFNKDVSELTLSECTVLAGITQNPSKYNPISGRDANEEKRRIILQNMVDQGYISAEEQAEALADDVYDRIQDVDMLTKENSTPYSYFTDELIDQVMDVLTDRLGYSENQASNLLYSGGLQIYTTQDPEIQAIVDEEVNNPDNYTAAKYSVEYRLSVTHADGTTEHFSENTLSNWHTDVLGDSYDGLYDSQEAAQNDVEQYRTWQLKEDDQVIGESLTMILQPQISFVLMDQYTGEVKAISGGRGEKTASRTLNRATNVVRQPGSVFKVLTCFAPALDTCGATLGTVYYDAPYTVGTKTFKNWYSSGPGYLGYSNIREGIIYSMNIVAVRCMMETVTPQLGIEYAKNLGITTLVDKDVTPAAALGGLTNGVSNLELTAAFSAIANGGVYTKPIFFTKILDHNGRVLVDNQPETKRVLKDSTAFLLTDAMSESLEANRHFSGSEMSVNSTSTRAALSGMSAAGKSGTTTANNDVWFVGFTPYYTAGVWGGCDNNQKLTAANGGTSYHKDIWRKIMTRVHEGLSDPGFTVPDSIETAEICRKSGKLAVPGVCSEDPRGNAVYTEYFAKGTVPTEVCNNHIRATVCSESGQLATEYCPDKTSCVFMSIPSGETAVTDDSLVSLPGYCTIHSSSSVIINPNAPVLPSSPGSSQSTSPSFQSPSSGTVINEYEDDVISAAPPPG